MNIDVIYVTIIAQRKGSISGYIEEMFLYFTKS